MNLILTDGENDKGDFCQQYSAITNLGGLLNNQYSRYKKKTYYCYLCLHGFAAREGEKTREECKALNEHKKYCKTQTPQKVVYPTEKDKLLKFNNIKKTLKAPFVMYADFEAQLEALDTNADTTPGVELLDGSKKLELSVGHLVRLISEKKKRSRRRRKQQLGIIRTNYHHR